MNSYPTVLRIFFTALLIGIALVSDLPPAVHAQSGTIRFETLSIEDGLSQGTVRAIVQDSDGFMWFGTDDGLNKYDGYTFTIYKHDPEDPSTLSNSAITAGFKDSRGNLWFGTNNGLNRFDRETETFERFLDGPSGLSISAIAEDPQGFLWIGASDGGLIRFDTRTGEFTRYRHDPDRPDSLINDMVLSLSFDPKGGLWVGTYSGLDFFDPATGQFTHYRNIPNDRKSLGDDRVWALFRDHYGILWVGTEDGGLNRFNPITQDFTRYQTRPNNPYTLTSNYVRTIFEDQNGQLWVGGRNGLHLFNRADDYFIRYQHDPNDPVSLSNDYVLSIASDRAGVLWVGTYGGGLSKYVQSNERFHLYQHRPGVPNSLSNDLVNAIYEDKEGAVWVGTMDGGLNRLDPEANTFFAFRNDPNDPYSLSSNEIHAVYEDRQGRLWVGTYGGGLNRFDRDSGRFFHYKHSKVRPASISDDHVMALYEDSRGNFWVGTRYGGLNLMNRETGEFKHFQYGSSDPDHLIGEFVRVIYEDSEGNLWIGTYNGISVMDPITQQFHHYQHEPDNPNSLSSNRVLSIVETEDGDIWIGTMLGGLNRFDRESQTFQHYTQKQGLPSDTVYGILSDSAGFLWMSTNRGLSRFDPKTETFRNYDRRDGLQSYEFSAGAYFQNAKGRMYFGGVQGFNAFDPKDIQDNPTAPPVIITAFKKFNVTEKKNLVSGDTITLSYQDNFISFEFAALDYSAPDKNQYAYKLEGFDKDWVYAGTRRYASYTNLRGGTYTFHVIGSNQDGTWNNSGASVQIIVTPPIWERWWFLGGLGLILVSGVFGGYRLRVQNMQAQNRRLEQQVQERTKEVERRREVAEGLREILKILNSNRSLKESLDCIVLQIERLMNADDVVIFRCVEEGCPMILASSLPGDSKQRIIPASSSLPGWVISQVLQGQLLLLPDFGEQLEQQPELCQGPLQQYSSLLAVPVMVNDKTDGGLAILYQNAYNFSEEDIKMALSFANHAALAIANAQLRSQAEETAVSMERSRLARDLHDSVTQTLFATSLIAEVLPRLWERSPEIGKQKVMEIRELTRGALAEMRALLLELRPNALIDVSLSDLLQQLSEAFIGRARVPVRLDLDQCVELPPNVKIGFYRIAQEALNNISKHARANQVTLSLRNCDGNAVLCIADDGIGFDTQIELPDHFGLGIMEERAQSIGAHYVLQSQKGEGTQITVTWKKPS